MSSNSLSFNTINTFNPANDFQAFKMIQHFIHIGFARIVRDDDNLCVRIMLVRSLDNGFQADVIFSKHLRNLGKYTCFIVDMKQNEILYMICSSVFSFFGL